MKVEMEGKPKPPSIFQTFADKLAVNTPKPGDGMGPHPVPVAGLSPEGSEPDMR